MKDKASQGTSSAPHYGEEPAATGDFGQRLVRLERAHEQRVTRVHLSNTEKRLNRRMSGLEKRLNGRMGGLEKRLRDDLASKTDLTDLEKRLRDDLASKTDLAALEIRMLRYMIYIGAVLLAALLPLLIFIALAV